MTRVSASGSSSANPCSLERHVGEQQMMVDHHHVRLGGTPARLRDVASVEHGTLRPEAVVRRRGDRAPDRIVLREVVHLREVAARRPGGPSREAGGPRGHVGRDEPAGGQHLLVAPEAEVVRAALEQRDARVASEGAADERQIVLEQLLLKMAGAGGDHDPAAAGDGGNEVREGLAGPGSGLADEDVPLRHGTLDRGGHGPLLGTGRVARQQPRQRTGRGKDTVAGSGGVHLPRPGTPPANESGEVSGEAAIADTITRARTRSPYRRGSVSPARRGWNLREAAVRRHGSADRLEKTARCTGRRRPHTTIVRRHEHGRGHRTGARVRPRGTTRESRCGSPPATRGRRPAGEDRAPNPVEDRRARRPLTKAGLRRANREAPVL